jgi:tetratricopeptide (TPR) repeat protein
MFCFENGQTPQAVPLLEKALEAMRKATDADPGNLEQQAELARCWHNLGWVRHQQGDLSGAAEPYRKGLAIDEQLTREHPEAWLFATERGLGLACLGQLHCDKGEPQAGLENFSRAVDILNRIVASPSAAAQGRDVLREALTGRANALIMLKRYAEAVKDLDQALPLAAPDGRPLLRLARADALVRSGQHPRAAKEVEAVLGEPLFPKDGLFNAACIFALATGQETDRNHAERYAQRAVQLLTKAQAAGFFKAADRRGLLDRDPDLASLRGRKDFESLRNMVKE